MQTLRVAFLGGPVDGLFLKMAGDGVGVIQEIAATVDCEVQIINEDLACMTACLAEPGAEGRFALHFYLREDRKDEEGREVFSWDADHEIPEEFIC